jgi:hypothetical protein
LKIPSKYRDQKCISAYIGYYLRTTYVFPIRYFERIAHARVVWPIFENCDIRDVIMNWVLAWNESVYMDHPKVNLLWCSKQNDTKNWVARVRFIGERRRHLSNPYSLFIAIHCMLLKDNIHFPSKQFWVY